MSECAPLYRVDFSADRLVAPQFEGSIIVTKYVR